MYKPLLFITLLLFTMSCTTQGNLEYITANGERKTACETEYSGAPSVDKYAVEYILSYCAHKATAQGNRVIDSSLLTLDLSVPKTPNGEVWTFEYATQLHQSNKITDKEYGYLIAYIDLGLHK